jgi:hypothetical protein
MYCQMTMSVSFVHHPLRAWRRLGLRAVGLLGLALLAACSSGTDVNIVSSQPVDTQTVDFGLAYIKRSVPTTQDDLRLRRPYALSADLYLLQPASQGGMEQNITARVTSSGPWDIKDVDVSSDGTRIIFAMRGPLVAKQKDFATPTWNIWEYVVATDTLHMLVPTSDPLGTGAEYVSPHYLADGRILFSTTRQVDAGSVLINEGEPEFEAQTEDLNESAFVLHVMDAPTGTGTGIQTCTGLHQLTFNQSHDVDATVLNNGRIMYSRWDHANGNSGIHLYTANPDGTDVELLYGFGSHVTANTNPAGATACPADLDCTVQFVRAREMPGGQVLALNRPFTPANFGGNLQIINTQNFIENNYSYPGTLCTQNNQSAPCLSATTGMQPATQNNVIAAVNTAGATPVPAISPGGRFSSAFPLWDGSGRILVTWTDCRLANTVNAVTTILPCTSANLATAALPNSTMTEATPLYSAWMFDPAANTFAPLLLPVEGVMVTDIVALQPRPNAPAYIADSYTAATPAVGVLDIRSIYDWDGAQNSQWLPAGGIAQMAQSTADSRQARFLRVEMAVSIPPAKGSPPMFALNFDRNTAFGVAGNYMREILEYVPIEPDGSVRVQVPANVAFQISVVNIQDQRIMPLHAAWLQVKPGEVLSCNGCHTPAGAQQVGPGQSSYSHGRSGLFASAWNPTLTAAALYPGTLGPYTVCSANGVTDTMAETLAGSSCGTAPNNAVTPSVNLVYVDPWFGGGAGNEPVTISYDDPTFTTPLPTSLSCALANGVGVGWNTGCRIEIDYDHNIQPLWDKARPLGGVVGAGTCNSAGCHTGTTVITSGNLDLSDGPSVTNANQDNAYVQLTQDVTTTTEVNGQPVVTVVRPQEINSGDALNSRFFTIMSDAIHTGLLSPSELRMVSEWADIGAQYYNDPFNAPLAN